MPINRVHLQCKQSEQLAISAMSFWEIALLAVMRRLELCYPPAELRAERLNTGVIELALQRS
jgi:PIN domain nuclease of toxin-antitoxin system